MQFRRKKNHPQSCSQSFHCPLQSNNTTVLTCFHWWCDDAGWFLQFSIAPIANIFLFLTFANCRCNFGVRRTTHDYAHNRCIVLNSPSNTNFGSCMCCSFAIRLFCMFAFTLGCLGSTFKFCSFFVLSLFHSGSFTPLSVSLFFLANCFQWISESQKSSGWGLPLQ